MNLFEHEIQITNRQMLVDITDAIKKDIEKSGVREGLIVVYCPHTTAGITINENADPDVKTDLIHGFEKAYPTIDKKYLHYEGNSHAHLKASTVGSSETLIIHDGKLILGTWQGIYFCEFDGPRIRHFHVKIMEG